MNADNQTSDPSCIQEASALADRPSDFESLRAHPRYAVDEASTLQLISHGLSLKSHILDLSLEGCRLRLLEPYTVAKGTRVEVAFKVNGVAFRFAGLIQWTDQNHLAGIHFVDIISRRREQLAEVVSEMQRAAEARAAEELARKTAAEGQTGEAATCEPVEAPRHVEQPKLNENAPRDAENEFEREPREQGQLQEIASIDRAARKSELQMNGEAQEKCDRRTQTRHHVDTTATVLLIRIGSNLRGHIVDLSMSGCRIRSDERFPVGIYTRVETEFRLEGLPFLLGGVIQTIHDHHNVGIRFLDMSLRKREQLEQLIAEIASLETSRFEEQIQNSASRSEANSELLR